MNKPVSYGSVCSGIEAASVAWDCLGWQPAWFAEIEKFPSAFEDDSHIWDARTSKVWGETGMIIIENIGEKNA